MRIIKHQNNEEKTTKSLVNSANSTSNSFVKNKDEIVEQKIKTNTIENISKEDKLARSNASEDLNDKNYIWI